MFTDFLKKIEDVIEVRKQEVALPIARKAALVKPLRVGDDLALRTLLASPVNYDREMTKILWRNSEIIDPDTQESEKMDYNQFISAISNIDKIVLMWGLYSSTYESFAPRTIKCTKCDNEFKRSISMNELVHDDSLTIWEEEVPFQQYIYLIEVPYRKIKYLFETRIPTVRDNNKVLSSISIDVLQKNLETTRMVLSRSEQMALLTKKVTIVDSNTGSELASTSNINDMLIAFKDHVPYDVSEVFFEMYRDKFDKYNPKFYLLVQCPACNDEIRLDFDIEFEFFRRVIFGRESGD